jgi:hypothetical protein
MSTDRPAGWYPDPTNPRVNHYWTGVAWGDPPDSDPATTKAETVRTADDPIEDESTRGLLICGYTIGVLIPFIGWIIAITIGVQDRYKRIRSHAVGIALASITAAVIYVVVIVAVSHHISCTPGARVADNVARGLGEPLPYQGCQ